MSVRRFSFACLLLLFLPAVRAQAPPPEEEVDKRLLGIFPNYRAAAMPSVYTHPTVREKFEISRLNMFDWPNYFITAGYALQNQISQRGVHQTAFGKNFAKYYARSFADGLIGNYTVRSALPSLLGEDPRYYRMGTGSGWKRAYHAVSWVAVTRGVDGRNRIHLSELAGNVGVVAVSNLYYPDANRGIGASSQRWALALGNDAIANLLTEFLPDLKRKFRKR